MAGIPTLTLKNVPFQEVGFTPTQYQYQGEDLSILERSLAQREARTEKAYQQINAVDTALGGIEQQLNPAEAAWFNDYKNNIKQKLRDSVTIGNPGAAIRNSYDLAGKTASDSAVLSRVEANKQYTEWENTQKQRLAKGEISQDAFKWAMAKNPYGFTELKDTQGNVIGGKLNDLKQVYNTLNWDKVAATAASLFRPDVTTSDHKGGNSGPALYNTDDLSVSQLNGKLGEAASSWENGNQIEQVKSEDIINTIGALLGTPDLLNQAIQDWEVSVWNYNELTSSEKKDRVAQGLIVRGVPISLQEYLDQKTKLFADALSYKKESITSVKTNSFGFTTKAGTDVEGLNQDGKGYGNEQTPVDGKGKPVKYRTKISPGDAATDDGNQLDDQMNNAKIKNKLKK